MDSAILTAPAETKPGTADAEALSMAAEESCESFDTHTFVLHTRPVFELDDDQLLAFCRLNKALRIERTAVGELILMAPAGSSGGRREFKVYGPFYQWEERVGGGQCFGSTAGFKLPNGAVRAPDVAWVRQERLDQLTEKQWEGFAPLCPDFVLEFRSRTDRLPTLQKKMAEYIDNGARLGWLIDPIKKQVCVYRPGEPVEHLQAPATLSGGPVLAGFTLDLARIW